MSNHYHSSHAPKAHRERRRSKKKFLSYCAAALILVCVAAMFYALGKAQNMSPTITAPPNANAQSQPIRNESRQAEAQTTSGNQAAPELFVIENLKITKVENGALWTDVTFSFDFISGQGLNDYRDNTGKALINTYIEFYWADGTIEVSQTYGFDALGDNKYSDTVMCDDTELTKDRIISVTFSLFFGDYSVRVPL